MLDKDKLLREFREFLDSDITLESCLENVKEPGLYDLFITLSEVKNETKRAAKQMHQVQNTYEQSLAILQHQIDMQNSMQTQLKQYAEAESKRQINSVILNLLSHRDRCLRNRAVAKNMQNQLQRTLFNNKAKRLGNNLAGGLDMALIQIDEDLKAYGVQRVKAIGEIFDPIYMKNHVLERHEDTENMLVLDELVDGYMDQSGKLVRYAEVIVNKVELKA